MKYGDAASHSNYFTVKFFIYFVFNSSGMVSLKANSCSLIINLKNHLNIYHSSSFISVIFSEDNF
ncbi:hypothetical protein BpHYR1_015989 [Brachionus plicatilis]|uniref:Uncharacterized protein n=1 Tax=Brachionus plicatilis TaxID=10195 RepID=A0A3M7PAY4_BRAPC|nr:hypothetical protein BpHYR1_015989 [Brachionus plicatilis]